VVAQKPVVINSNPYNFFDNDEDTPQVSTTEDNVIPNSMFD